MTSPQLAHRVRSEVYATVVTIQLNDLVIDIIAGIPGRMTTLPAGVTGAGGNGNW